MKRVIIFWDYSNFNIALSQLSHKEYPDSKRFDYQRFADVLTQGMDLIKVYFACSSDAVGGEKLQAFFKWVDHQDYFYVKHFERRQSADGGREKQVDVYLATQIVALAYENAYDVGIIISGDEDFVPAIEIVQQKGKIIIAVSAEKMLSGELRKKADRVVLLNKPGDLNFKNFLL